MIVQIVIKSSNAFELSAGYAFWYLAPTLLLVFPPVRI